MNARLRVFVIGFSALALSACAGIPEKSTQATYSPPTDEMTADHAYVAYVERVARRRGIEVVWVNLPRTRVPLEDKDE